MEYTKKRHPPGMLEKAGEAVVEKVQVIVEEVKEAAAEAKDTIMGPLAGAGKVVRPRSEVVCLAHPSFSLNRIRTRSRIEHQARKMYVVACYLGNDTNLLFRTLLLARCVCIARLQVKADRGDV